MKKGLKSIVGILMLVAVTAAFFGVPFAGLACKVQPGVSWTFLAVLLLTPVFGRLFCECLCPLGFLQTLVNRLSHPKHHVRRVCTRLPETKTQRVVRWTVLALCVGLAAAGFGALAWFVTPYALYGKALTLVLPGLVLVGFVLLLAACGKGRFWCNWICPIGTLFNLLSKKSVCCHKVGPGCAHCRACFPGAQPKEPDASTHPSTQADDLTRREALQGVGVLAAVSAVEKTTDGGYAPISLPGVPERPASVLPPGAVVREVFTRTCVACGLCIARCPEKCLKPSMKLATFGQPEMDFRYGHCRVACTACSEACPTIALRKLTKEEKRNTHMGHAIWKKDLCIRTTDQVECTACVKKCPVKAIHLVEGFPHVDQAACIGCGACEHVCPSRPLPAIYVKGFDKQVTFVRMGEADLIAEMRARVVEQGQSSVSALNGVIVGIEAGKGLEPLFRLLESGKLKGALVVDKVIGRAAAAILVAGGAKKVHAILMSEEAKAFLAAKGLEAEAEKLVPKILNQDLSAGCPMESAVQGLEDPEAMVQALKEKTASLKGR